MISGNDFLKMYRPEHLCNTTVLIMQFCHTFDLYQNIVPSCILDFGPIIWLQNIEMASSSASVILCFK